MFGERLKKLRNERKLTQEQLGKKINVTKVSISGYENGNRTPDTETLQKIADLFEVTTDYLLGRSIEPDLTKDEDKKLTEETMYYLEILESLPDDERKEFEKKINEYAAFLRSQKK